MAVHFEARKLGLKRPFQGIHPRRPRGHQKARPPHHSSRGAPLVVMFMGYTPLFAAAMAIAATVVASWFSRETPHGPEAHSAGPRRRRKGRRGRGRLVRHHRHHHRFRVPHRPRSHLSAFRCSSTWEKGSSNLGGVFVMVMSTILEHGRARRCGLRHRCGRGRARAYRRRRAAHVRPHVLPLLRLPLQHHAAGGHVVLRGRRHRQLQRNQNLPHRRAAGTLRLHPCRSSSSTIRCCSTAPPIPDSPPCGPSSPQASASAPSPWASNAGSSAPVPCLQSLMFIAGPPVLTIDPGLSTDAIGIAVILAAAALNRRSSSRPPRRRRSARAGGL